MALVFLSLLVLFVGASAQVPGFGTCPEVPVQQDFQPDKYTGIWYEYERYFAIFEAFGRCTYANYTLKPNGRINVVNTLTNSLTGSTNAAHGEAYAPDSSSPSKLVVQFDQSPVPGPYWVLETDYDHYTIIYSCSNITTSIIPTKAEIIWILSRDRAGPGAELVEHAEALIERLGLRVRYLMKIDQTNCPSIEHH
ncbi:apolipoprotein D-like [Lineus longissimus]|uniref:apolipoprotein D-like n=1 Tax=Lineus longissimus TaxID=88925 RepID=UPI002B4DB8ED